MGPDMENPPDLTGAQVHGSAAPVPPKPNSPLLVPKESVVLPATTAPFVVKDQIKASAGIRFSSIWNEFSRRFVGKVEAPRAEIRLCKYTLLRIAPDGPIIAELGGESKVASPISCAFELIRRQANGEEGFLQINGFANIFYVLDLKNELSAVRFAWDGDGWVIDAISVKDPLAWNGKHEIFSPMAP